MIPQQESRVCGMVNVVSGPNLDNCMLTHTQGNGRTSASRKERADMAKLRKSHQEHGLSAIVVVMVGMRMCLNKTETDQLSGLVARDYFKLQSPPVFPPAFLPSPPIPMYNPDFLFYTQQPNPMIFRGLRTTRNAQVDWVECFRHY
ncbi:hypothetical protein DMENIID0001_024880 [Sergentomyia squamirostris]